MGVIRAQNVGDRSMNSIRIAKDIMIPEAEHSITFILDDGCSIEICWHAVLSAIDFDHELGTVTGEIGNEMSDGDLPAEVGIRKRLSQQAPHAPLRFSGLAS